MKLAEQVTYLIAYGPKQDAIPLSEIIQFAQEISPDVTLETEGDWMNFVFPDESSVMLEYRRSA